jgi:hypothetical protein
MNNITHDEFIKNKWKEFYELRFGKKAQEMYRANGKQQWVAPHSTPLPHKDLVEQRYALERTIR